MAVTERDLLAQWIGRKVREARAERGYTMELCAGLCGHTVGTQSNIERGKQVPTGEVLIMLAYVLGKPIDWFIPERDKVGLFARERSPFLQALPIQIISQTPEKRKPGRPKGSGAKRNVETMYFQQHAVHLRNPIAV